MLNGDYAKKHSIPHIAECSLQNTNHVAEQNIDSKEKKPTLYLHIGTSKTGTSALQAYMAENQAILLQNKICYSDFLPHEYHHANLILSLMQEVYDRNNAQIELRSHDFDYARFVENPTDIINRMMAVFHENNCDTLIISSDVLFRREGAFLPLSAYTECLNGVCKSFILHYFKDFFKDFQIKIVVYLRRQDDLIESAYNEYCKQVPNREQFLRRMNPPNYAEFLSAQGMGGEFNTDSLIAKYACSILTALDYYDILSEWAEIYGKENIIVRPFEKTQLPKGIEYDFFTNVLGFSDNILERLPPDKGINVSIKKDLVEYRIAAELFALKEEFFTLNNVPALKHLSQNNNKSLVTAKLAKFVLELFKECNEKIAREYLNRQDGILFIDPIREEKDDYPGLSQQAIIDISRELILMLHDKSKKLESQCFEMQQREDQRAEAERWGAERLVAEQTTRLKRGIRVIRSLTPPIILWAVKALLPPAIWNRLRNILSR